MIINLPNNKASGSDGVTYKMLKSGKSTLCPVLTNIFNICLENGKVPEAWKGALIHRIPKKDNIPDDPSTWRDISLLPTVYKVFMKCLLSRILPWLVETGTLSSKQKAYITVFLDCLNTFAHSDITFSKQLTHRIKLKLNGQNDSFC